LNLTPLTATDGGHLDGGHRPGGRFLGNLFFILGNGNVDTTLNARVSRLEGAICGN